MHNFIFEDLAFLKLLMSKFGLLYFFGHGNLGNIFLTKLLHFVRFAKNLEQHFFEFCDDFISTAYGDRNAAKLQNITNK